MNEFKKSGRIKERKKGNGEEEKQNCIETRESKENNISR